MKKLNKRELLKLRLPTRPAGTNDQITFETRLDSCGGQRVLLVSLFLPQTKSAGLTVYLAKQDYTTRIWEGEEAGWREAGLENIYLPDVFCCIKGRFTTLNWLTYKKDQFAVSVETAKRANRFMKTDARKSLEAQIYAYQSAIREARRLEQAGKKAAGLDKLMAVDRPVPPGMALDMQKLELDEARYLIYRRKGKKRTGAYCTSCNSSVELDPPPAHKQGAVCPRCGKTCIAMAAGRGRDQLWQHGGYCLAELNGTGPHAGLALREFYVTRSFSGEPPYPVMWEERARYLFDTNGTALRLLPEIEWNYRSKARIVRWKPAGKCNETMCGYSLCTGFWETLESSCMRYSWLAEYFQKSPQYHKPIEWLALYAKRPQIEKLAKEGFYHLVQEKVEYPAQKETCIDWSKDTVPGMLGMNRAELVAVKGKWSEGGRTEQRILQAKKFRDLGLAITGENLRLMDKIGYHIGFFLERAEEYGAKPCLKYLRAQTRKQPKKSWSWLMQEWNDIYRMAKSEKIKMTKAKAFAPDMVALHDELAALQRARLQREQEARERMLRIRREKNAEAAIKKAQKDIEKSAFRALVLAPLAWTEGEYLIRPAATPEEIIREGIELEHCVADYAESHAEGETNIFFVRKVAEPNKSLVTLELNLKQHRIVQQHGYDNERHGGRFDPAVAAFTARWLEQIVKPVDEVQLVKQAKAKQKKAKKAAAEKMVAAPAA